MYISMDTIIYTSSFYTQYVLNCLHLVGVIYKILLLRTNLLGFN